ncbi:MAG: PAS domain S-box protein [Bacteroidetes bacterium]|nr:PAS domain S-box protein [Bacteroidota bacterium]
MLNKLRKKILIVEDNNEDFSLLCQQLVDIGYSGSDILKFSSISDILSVPDEMLKVIFINLSLIELKPVITFRQLQKIFARVPVILLTRPRNVRSAVELLQDGAEDYLVKGAYDAKGLEQCLNSAIARKQFYNTLENTKTDYLKLFEDSPMPMFIYDSATLQFLAVNAAATDTYGYTRDEFLSMDLPGIRAADDEFTQMETIKLPAINSFYNSGRRRLVKKNGQSFYAQVYIHNTRFDGKRAGVMLAFDIHKKVLMEKRNEELNEVIRQQNEQFDSVLSATEEVIWSCDAADFSVLFINEAAFQVYGYTPGEIINDKTILTNIIHPEDRKVVADTFNLLPVVSNVSVEYRIRHRDGSLKTVVTRAVMKKDKKSNTKVITGITLDVTQLRSVENKLRDNVKEMAAILESITEGFYSVNTDWNLTYINKQFERILGIKRSDIVGKNLWEVFPGQEQKEFYRAQQRAMLEQVDVSFEDYYPAFGKWLFINVHPAMGGLTVYMRDITDEKKKMLKIEAQNEVLKEIAWLQSHKVRGPVASILGLAQLFNYSDPSDPMNQEILEGIKFASTGLDNIIREVVDKTSSADLKSDLPGDKRPMT